MKMFARIMGFLTSLGMTMIFGFLRLHYEILHYIRNDTTTSWDMIGYNKSEGFYTYYVYVITNSYRSTFYIGMTNNLGQRLIQHKENITKRVKSFAAKYNLKHLVYYERFSWVQNAIVREKELKGWRREKKLDLIRSFNKDFEFLENRFLKE